MNRNTNNYNVGVRELTFPIHEWTAHGWNNEGNFLTVVSSQPFPCDRSDNRAYANGSASQDCILEKIDLGAVNSHTGLSNLVIGLNDDQYVEVGPEQLINCSPLDENVLPWTSRSVVEPARFLYGRLKAQPTVHRVNIQQNPFDSEFSLWYLFVDLKEIPKLAKSLLSSKLLRFKSNKPLKDLSNDYLAVQFGLLPTIADLRDFTKLLIKWDARYRKSLSFMSELYTHHAPHEFVGTHNQHPTTINTHVQLSTQEIPISFELSPGPLARYSTTKYYFVCPELTGFFNRIRQFIDLLGLFDPAAFWDVIPFSFLVDWFYPVGQWIHKNLKPRMFPADIVICDYCESVGRSTHVDIGATYYEPNTLLRGLGTRGTRQILSGHLRQYTRCAYGSHQYPTVGAGFDLNDTIVTIRRTFIGSALVIQGTAKQGHKSNKHFGRRARA